MNDLKKEIEKREFRNLYLFYGEEDYLKNSFHKMLEKEVLEAGMEMMNYNYFDGKNLDVNKVIDASEMVPFMSEYRLIVVENSGFFASGKSEQSEILLDYMVNIPKSTIILFIEQKILKSMKICKKFFSDKEKFRPVDLSKLPISALVSWAKKEAENDGVKIDNKTAEYLFEITKSDMMYVQTEIKKLTSYCMDTKIITKSDIDKLVNKSLEVKIFDLMDFIGNKKKDEAFLLFRELIEKKESPVKIVFLIAGHLRQVMICKVLSEERYSPQEIAKKIGSYDTYVRKYISQGRNFTVNSLAKAMEKCLETDIAIKTGVLNEVYALEILIAEL